MIQTQHIVIFSGGLDSTTALAVAIQKAGKENTRAISFRYGQTHSAPELEAAQEIADFYRIPLEMIDLDHAFTPSALTGYGAIPSGHYAAESMASTEVIGRNLLFASIGISKAGRRGVVWLGVHGGDHDLYPDCRPDFWGHVIATGAAYGVGIRTPFIRSTKGEIVTIGDSLGVPFGLTYSCYRGGEIHCGTCSTCLERREAFESAGVVDPTHYQNL